MSKQGSYTTADYLPYEDYQRLVQIFYNEKRYWWATYCVVAFCTGLRFSDLSRIKWKDILGERKLIITAKKTGKTHVIPIGESASQHFDDLYEKRGRPKLDTYVIGSQESNGHMPVSIQYVNKKLKRFAIKYKLNLDNFSTHTFRKTFGRYVYESNGCSEKSLMYLTSIFKHTSLETTRRYLGLRNDELTSIYQGIKI